ncbi:hypothetical protein SSCG_01932 [Streptomyces clavuligerus]|nr:hypothetical protein SSCG_01932 [Streptomyces clavuligerus]
MTRDHCERVLREDAPLPWRAETREAHAVTVWASPFRGCRLVLEQARPGITQRSHRTQRRKSQGTSDRITYPWPEPAGHPFAFRTAVGPARAGFSGTSGHGSGRRLSETVGAGGAHRLGDAEWPGRAIAHLTSRNPINGHALREAAAEALALQVVTPLRAGERLARPA